MNLEQYDTDREWTKYGLRVRVTRRFGKREMQCRIELDTWSDNHPSVAFRRRHPDSDASVLESWSSIATGALGGSQRLRAWMELTNVFQAALAVLVDEIDGAVLGDQAAIYERRTDELHPVFAVPHRPERKRVTEDAE